MVKNKTQLQRLQTITILFAYGLFALTLLNVIVTTVIPFGSALFHPTARYFNIIVFLVTFAAAALLPVLGSYWLGDRATHAKNKVLHHYNGVLFGIAAYWAAQVFGFIVSSFYVYFSQMPIPAPVFIGGIIPIILTILVMAFVATLYARNKKSGASVLSDRPYQVVMLGGFIATIVIPLSPQYFSPQTIPMLALMYVVIPLVLIAISYKCIAGVQPTRTTRVTAASVAVSIFYIASTSAAQLISYISYNMIVPIVFGAVVWIAYLVLVVYKKARR